MPTPAWCTKEAERLRDRVTEAETALADALAAVQRRPGFHNRQALRYRREDLSLLQSSLRFAERGAAVCVEFVD